MNHEIIHTAGLERPVEIIRDVWGINHIYAENQHDLFFAQGYAAAKDRLFQFEIWRRQATGSVAEILGEKELKRDIGTRLFKFRGNMSTEMNHYHDDGAEIITAYTDGVNAYIDIILKTPELLPIEFQALGILPKKWTPDVVISRHQGLLGNINDELTIGRSVATIGAKKTKDLAWFHPKDPNIELDTKINGNLLQDNILELYNAYRQPLTFEFDHINPKYRAINDINKLAYMSDTSNDTLALGSNNWVVSGALMKDGHTYMANDPHRRIAVPSLRYMAHLVAPGWNVIGGGEPEIPGISIGHNDVGAWGLTVFRTDGEDLMVYDLNPNNLNQYNYQGNWLDMDVISETFSVKNTADVVLDLTYTKHGPVVYTDTTHLKAYAVRCAWLEPGGSPYLASLRMDQASSWDEFRDACSYSHIPGENMIWADKDGNIGWQAVGIAPIRTNFSGLVPVPGDGTYEWDGYLPILDKPHEFNPKSGFLATANQNVTPDNYEFWNAISYTWSDPYRGDRVNEVLSTGQQMTMSDMKSLQMDYTSLPARNLIPYLKDNDLSSKALKAYQLLSQWDFKLEPKSKAAAIYVTWENTIKKLMNTLVIPSDVKPFFSGLQMKKVMDIIELPDTMFKSQTSLTKQAFITNTFESAVKELTTILGPNMSAWSYGQSQFKHAYLQHSLGEIVNDSLKQVLNIGPLPRGGNAYTPNSTGGRNNQNSGASFRMIVNTGDWDEAIGSNGPGQSGNPKSPFYKNLFESWANDQYFPIYFSRNKIDSIAFKTFILKPNKN